MLLSISPKTQQSRPTGGNARENDPQDSRSVIRARPMSGLPDSCPQLTRWMATDSRWMSRPARLGSAVNGGAGGGG